MSNPMLDALAAAARNGQGPIVPMPSQAQRDEIARVQGMQVRTNAVTLAVQCQGHLGFGMDELMVASELIYRYILDGTFEPIGTPPVRPGS